jgi:pyruvate dehydrogenase E1 component beta subunit
LQSLFAHFPGLRVVMPALPGDAKGLTLSALRASGPVIVLEHRALYETEGPVAEAPVATPIGTAAIVRAGADVTIIAASFMVVEALRAVDLLEEFGVDVEIVDCRSIRPLDLETIVASTRKTGRVVIADTSWPAFGLAAELGAVCAEQAFAQLKAPIRRIGLADCPAPVSLALERVFYPDHRTIARECLAVLGLDPAKIVGEAADDASFRGPY